MLKRLLNVIMPTDAQARGAQVYRDIIREFARMGGQLFGQVPEGSRREFFCLDEHTWIWHEEWTGTDGMRRIRTTRYDIRPHGIFKAQDGQPYQPLKLEEMNRLYMAMYHYDQNVQAAISSLAAAA
ncbi:MAG TPA: hypothetical protein VLF40_01775 [Candidatus Saccharimonadales bacterium]|nr:hypothetical protein [Candidatus Saccharimonadales bacterium]